MGIVLTFLDPKTKKYFCYNKIVCEYL